MKVVLVFVAIIAISLAGCPSVDLLRSDRVKQKYNPAVLNDGTFYEVLFNDFAQTSSMTCQRFVRTSQPSGAFSEVFTYEQGGKTQTFNMIYDTTDTVGVYAAHPVFEVISRTPATVIDFAEDGSWTILHKCISLGFLKIVESVEVMSKNKTLNASQLAEVTKQLNRAGVTLKLGQVDHSKCQFES